jgi:outer membrane protein assembly factor BamD
MAFMKSRGIGVASRLLLVFFILAATEGCGLWAKREPAKTPQGMFNEAQRLLEKKKYTQAAEAFKKFKEEYPLSTYTPLAELRTADALYFDKNYAEAIVLYEEFKKLHPVHQEVPYATYQVGMCYFQQMLSIDRDQTNTEKAMEQFRYLIENFPQGKYVPSARTKMQLCARQLADHEFYVGHFYYRMGNYKGALGRFEGILRQYPDTGLEGKIKPYIKTCREKIAKEERKLKEKEEKQAKKAREKNSGNK